MKFQIAFSLLVFGSALSFGSHRVQGGYFGTCYANYAGTNANPCQMEMLVDEGNVVTVFGNANCISPVNCSGLFYDEGTPVQLNCGGWAAQPRGQTLTLNFRESGQGQWLASGSGGGIKDRKWTYNCSFVRQ